MTLYGIYIWIKEIGTEKLNILPNTSRFLAVYTECKTEKKKIQDDLEGYFHDKFCIF